MFTNNGLELPSKWPLTAMMYKNGERLVNQIFVLLEFAVDLLLKEVLAEAHCGASI